MGLEVDPVIRLQCPKYFKIFLQQKNLKKKKKTLKKIQQCICIGIAAAMVAILMPDLAG